MPFFVFYSNSFAISGKRACKKATRYLNAIAKLLTKMFRLATSRPKKTNPKCFNWSHQPNEGRVGTDWSKQLANPTHCCSFHVIDFWSLSVTNILSYYANTY